MGNKVAVVAALAGVMAMSEIARAEIAVAESSVAEVSEAEVVKLLEKMPGGNGGGPRVIWAAGDEVRVRRLIESDREMGRIWKLVLAGAEENLKLPPVERKLVGRRLLDKSRTALGRMTHLGMAYRITGEQRFADRAKAEMLAIAGFSDWNPSHFLDVGEMTAAMAIGVDWCGAGIDAESRAVIRAAIVEKGLKQSFAEKYWWLQSENNWNQVCHGGLILGAIVVGDEEKELAAKVIVRGVGALPRAMGTFAPDGAYPEGASYWGYGTVFNVVAISAMEGALGTDFGLCQQPGFLKTGKFYQHVAGPTGAIFNYSDSWLQTRPEPTAPMFWLAKRTGDASLVFSERQWIERAYGGQAEGAIDGAKAARGDRFRPMILVWGDDTKPTEPKERSYSADGITPVAMHRTSWGRDAAYVGIKGGGAFASHAHMDSGAFVYDAMGERWAEDLGAQDYESLESKKIQLWNAAQDGQRWQIFRIGPMAHNVLTVDGKLHVVKGKGTIVKSGEDRTVLDLSPVYEGQLASAERGVRLEKDGGLTLRDEVEGLAGGEVTVRWAMLTKAKVELAEGGAVLSKGGKRVRVILAGEDVMGVAVREFSTVGPADFDVANPGVSMIGFEVKVPAGAKRSWRVSLVPEGAVAGEAGALGGW